MPRHANDVYIYAMHSSVETRESSIDFLNDKNFPGKTIYVESEAKKSALTFLRFKTLILMIVLFCVYVLKVDTLRIPKW